MSSNLAEKMKHFQGSATSKILTRVAELKSQGRDVISLNVGEPDFGTPDHIKKAGILAIQEDFTKYTPASGIMELRLAIARKLNLENGISYRPEEIIVSVGAKEALASAMMAILDPGDEVIIPVPCYVSYGEMTDLAGGKPVYVPLQEDFSLDLQAIEGAVNDRTKAVIICTPNNPTGSVYDRQSLEALADLAVKKDFFVISDEIYEKLLYGDKEHVSIAALSPEIRDRSILVNGMSKTYAMTGWRIGYTASRQDVAEAIGKIQSQLTTSPVSISQKAAVEALKGSQDMVETMRREYEKRMEYSWQRLNQMEGIFCPKPGGAFYLFFDASSFIGRQWQGEVINSDMKLCQILLEEGVATVAGSTFFKEGWIRISYATSMELLEKAMDRIQQALGKIV